MDRKPYPTDITEAQWEKLQFIIAEARKGGPPMPTKHDLREVLNGIRYKLRTGVPWKCLPHDLPTWESLAQYVSRWKSRGIWDRVELILEATNGCKDIDARLERAGEQKKMRKRKIYVASSWRSTQHEEAVQRLRDLGHEVFDYRNPGDGDHGFNWKEISSEWEQWDAKACLEALSHHTAERGFRNDFGAMQWADTLLMVPSYGRSAHLEAGWMVGAGKETFIVLEEDPTPELMIKMCDHICLDLDSAIDLIGACE